MVVDDCFLCRKHLGQEASPPGGYIYEDASWMLCHAPVQRGPLGTLFIESRRHILDFGDFSAEEARSFGQLTHSVYCALRQRMSPQRIYQVSMMEGVAHFHAWILPRQQEIPERGVPFLALDLTCSEAAAAALAADLRLALRQQ